MRYILAPSLLAADFNILGQQIRETEEAGAEYLHIDVMDGHFVAVTGPNGGGKSTLAKLIAGILKPSGGQILLDGVDVRDYRIKDLRQRVAVVLQETILFSGTIRDNIKWGKGDATEEEIIAAAKAASSSIKTIVTCFIFISSP